MDYTINKYTPLFIRFYDFFGNLNNILIALVLSTGALVFEINSSRSVLRFVSSFIFSYCLSNLIFLVTKKIYKPKYLVKEKMNLADFIDTSIGPKKEFDLVSEDLYNLKYRYNLSIRTFYYSVMFSIFLAGIYSFFVENTQVKLPFFMMFFNYEDLLKTFITFSVYYISSLVVINNIKLTLDTKTNIDYIWLGFFGLMSLGGLILTLLLCFGVNIGFVNYLGLEGLWQ